MSDQYEGVTTPDPKRAELIRSVFRPSSLEEIAEAISAASEEHQDIYVERTGGQWRWSFATKGGPYPLLRTTARYLQMDYCSLVGVGSREVRGGWCVQIVHSDTEPDAWAVLRFEEWTSADQVGVRVQTEVIEK